MIFALVAMLTLSANASAMSYEQARNEALFLTDKMAYELNLTDAQYEAAYEINLDYLMGVTSVDDVYGPYWERRNLDLSYILYEWQWEAFRAATYFFRPLYWNAGYWHFAIYARYPHRDYFYYGRPHFYATYRGGHSWHMNGGRSYYHGRAEHFRPALPANRQHFGMRDGFDRGDYRHSRPGSSTRVTSGHSRMDRSDRRNEGVRGRGGAGTEPRRDNNNNRHYGSGQGSDNNRHYDNGRSSDNSHSGSGNFSGGRSSSATPSRSFSGSPDRTTGSSSSATPSRSYGGSSSSATPTRSFSGTPHRTTGSSSSATPSRSYGSSSSSSSPSRSYGSSSSSTRSFGSSTRSSGGGSHSGGRSGGHFSGGRR